MMVLCVVMMWRAGKSGTICEMMCWPRDQADRDRRPPDESPLETLNRRYALGEIDKADYEEKKAAITESTPIKNRLPAGIGSTIVE